MSLTLTITALAISLFVAFATSLRREARAGLQHRTPVHQASRILAHRYASGQITADEYGRMIEVLRQKS